MLNITGGNDLTLHEVNAAAETIYEVVDPNANIIFGAVIDEKMQGEVRITVIATGFTGEPQTGMPTKVTTVPNRPLNTPPEISPELPLPKPSGLDIPEFLQRRRFPPNR